MAADIVRGDRLHLGDDRRVDLATTGAFPHVVTIEPEECRVAKRCKNLRQQNSAIAEEHANVRLAFEPFDRLRVKSGIDLD